MAWEVAYTMRQNGWPPVHPEGKPFPLGIDGVEAFMWGYDFPTPRIAAGQTVIRAVYLTVAVVDVVFVATAPVAP